MPLTKMECDMLAQSLGNSLGPLLRQSAESEGNLVAGEIANLVYNFSENLRKQKVPHIVFRDCQFGDLHFHNQESN